VILNNSLLFVVLIVLAIPISSIKVSYDNQVFLVIFAEPSYDSNPEYSLFKEFLIVFGNTKLNGLILDTGCALII